MAIINPTYNRDLERLITVTWANITSADTPATHMIRGKQELIAVQAEGTWGGATCRLTGSLSNVTFNNASDMTQSPIAFTANAGAGVIEPYVYWKPSVTGGTGANVTVTMSYWVDE